MRNLAFERIAIASDHGGVALKAYLCDSCNCVDLGTNNADVSVDYPDFARKVAAFVQNTTKSAGILICKSGIGMSIAANKFRGIRALLSDGNLDIVKLSREHNDCNVICFGSDFITAENAAKCVEVFIQTMFVGGRHARRVEKLECFLKILWISLMFLTVVGFLFFASLGITPTEILYEKSETVLVSPQTD